MAKGKKTGGRDFKKGHKPTGHRPALTPEVVAFRKLTQTEIVDVGSVIVMGNLAAIREIVESDPKGNKKDSPHSALKVWIATCAWEGIKAGDVNTLNSLLDRLVGRVPTQLQINKPTGLPDYSNMTEEECDAKARELLEELNGH